MARTLPGIATAAGPKDKKIELTDRIPARDFGKTGIKLPILGFGGAALPKDWGKVHTYQGGSGMLMPDCGPLAIVGLGCLAMCACNAIGIVLGVIQIYRGSLGIGLLGIVLNLLVPFLAITGGWAWITSAPRG